MASSSSDRAEAALPLVPPRESLGDQTVSSCSSFHSCGSGGSGSGGVNIYTAMAISNAAAAAAESGGGAAPPTERGESSASRRPPPMPHHHHGSPFPRTSPRTSPRTLPRSSEGYVEVEGDDRPGSPPAGGHSAGGGMASKSVGRGSGGSRSRRMNSIKKMLTRRAGGGQHGRTGSFSEAISDSPGRGGAGHQGGGGGLLPPRASPPQTPPLSFSDGLHRPVDDDDGEDGGDGFYPHGRRRLGGGPSGGDDRAGFAPWDEGRPTTAGGSSNPTTESKEAVPSSRPATPSTVDTGTPASSGADGPNAVSATGRTAPPPVDSPRAIAPADSEAAKSVIREMAAILTTPTKPESPPGGADLPASDTTPRSIWIRDGKARDEFAGGDDEDLFLPDDVRDRLVDDGDGGRAVVASRAKPLPQSVADGSSSAPAHGAQSLNDPAKDDSSGPFDVSPSSFDSAASAGATRKEAVELLARPLSSSQQRTPPRTANADEAVSQVSSTAHTPSKQTPMYSEEELQIRIRAAVLDEEKKWSEKVSEAAVATAIEAEAAAVAKRALEERKAEQDRLREELGRTKGEHDASVRRMKEEHERSVRELKERLEEELRVEREKREIAEKAAAEREGGNNDELVKQLEALRVQSDAERSALEAELKKQEDDNDAQIDSLIKELDLVVAEHEEKLAEAHGRIEQKDTIITALGVQLADASSRAAALDADVASGAERLEKVAEEADGLRSTVQSLEVALRESDEKHRRAIEEEESRRRVACDKVKKEMIAKAEQQFGIANEHYKKLKAEYENALEKAGSLEGELAKANAKVDAAKEERKAQEVKAMTEVARLKASLAAAESHAARNAQQHAAEMQAVLESEQNARTKLDEAKSNTAAAHMTLAAVVADKERLSQEVTELKSLSEELMEMLEGSGGNVDGDVSLSS